MKKTIRILAVMTLLCGLTGILSPGESAADGDSLRLIALNIGKADCMLLLWQDRAYLIDAGYAQTYNALEIMLREYGVEHLNGVFLTHCHKDHYGGLSSLAQSDIRVDAWYAARLYYDVEAGEHPMTAAAAIRGDGVTWLDAGNVIDAGGGAAFTVLGPLTVNAGNENNNSLVLRFSSPQGSILLSGDMKDDEENDLLAAGVFSACDVLKVGHHGDSKAAGKAFLRTVRPKVSLILTSSEEEEDTPAASTLTRLLNAGSDVYVSQDAQDALMVTLKNGVPTVEDVTFGSVPERTRDAALSMNAEDDTVTIWNTGSETLVLSGCVLYSTRGDETLNLPDIEIGPGDSFTIGTKTTKGGADLIWKEKRVWHTSKLDTAILYDAYGRPVARTNNGLTE